MHRKFIFILLAFMSGCVDEIGKDLVRINDELKTGKELSTRDGCIVDAVVSNIVDKHNFQMYTATFDVLARTYLSQKSIEINGCVGLISSERNGIDTFGEAYRCPSFMHSLDEVALNKLDKRAKDVVNAASNFENSALHQAFGRCVK